MNADNSARDTAFQVASSNVRIGTGITAEIGQDLQELGARKVLVVIDPALVDLTAGRTVLGSVLKLV